MTGCEMVGSVVVGDTDGDTTGFDVVGDTDLDAVGSVVVGDTDGDVVGSDDGVGVRRRCGVRGGR